MSIWDDTRADWGATPTSGMAFVAASRRDEFFNHYDGANPLGLADQPHSACLAKVKADQRFHMGPSRGWSDIGYNGLVCQHGRAIEGRGLDYAGAHCPDHNTRGYGIQFQVGGNEAPTQAAKDRMRRLYDDLCKRSGRQLSMKGHRDGLATLCPGDIVYSWVKAGMPSSGAAPAETPPTTPSTPSTLRSEWLSKQIKVHDDGRLSPATVKRLQAEVGATIDGQLGPATRKAVQTWLGVTADGEWGVQTYGALQRKVGASKVTGRWTPWLGMALQRHLNALAETRRAAK